MLHKISNELTRMRYSRKNELSSIFKIGKNVSLKKSKLGFHARVASHADVRRTIVGDYSSIGRYTKITRTVIGKYCAISWDTTINAKSHPNDHLTVRINGTGS